MTEQHLPGPIEEQPQEHTMSMLSDPEPNRGLHPVNNGHLVMGIAFAGLVAIWALVTGDVVADDNIRWLLPVPWVVAGAVGLVVATTASFRKPAPQPQHPAHDAGTATWTDPTTDPTEENR